MKELIDKIRKWITRNDETLPVIILSLLIFTIGIFVVGFTKSLILFLTIIIIYFGYEYGGDIMKRIKKGKRSTSSETKTTKVKRKKKLVNNIMIIILVCMGLGLLAFGGFAAYIVMNAPKFDVENLYTKDKSLVYDADLNVIAELGTEKREKVTFDELPQVLIDAIIATEDSNFFRHNGIDLGRFTVATVKQLIGKDGGGASTLSMQVVKNQFTSKDQTLIRKFTDIYLSVFKLEKKYTKQEIFEFYVNIPYLGNGAYGVQQASQAYFGKDVKDINLAEAAMIAGMFQAPGSYDPTINPENTKKRRSTVLYLMEKHGYITNEQRKAANSIEITDMLRAKNANQNKYQGFLDVVIKEVEDKTGQNPYNVSMDIYTTLKPDKQEYIERIMAGEIYKFKNDVIQTGVAVTDVNTGAIIAIGHGRNKGDAKATLNFATSIKRQIGSTAKPLFDYGPAIEYKDWSPATTVVDEPYSYSNGKPMKNVDGNYLGSIPIRTALTKSRNIPALKTFQSIDNKKILEFVQGLGIKPEIDNGRIHEAHSIGAFNGSNPLTMAAAYGAFANGGYYIEPYTVTKIVYNHDGSDEVFSPTKTRAMSDATAFLIADMLRSGVDNGNIDVSRINGIQYAAKTGTTNFDEDTIKKNGLSSKALNDLWVVGFDQQYSIGMWLGYEYLDKQYYNTTANWTDRKQLWNAIAKGIFENTGKKFEVPNSIVKVAIEAGTNPIKLASEYTPQDLIIEEYFKKGTEPTETSSTYMQIPNVTNLKVNHNNGSATLSWDATYLPETNGLPTYTVYLQNGSNLTELGSTDTTSFKTQVSENKKYTFIVKVSYSNVEGVSSGASIDLDLTPDEIIEKDVIIKLNGKEKLELNVGDEFKEPGIFVIEDKNDVSSKATWKVTGKVDTTKASEYTLTYDISYTDSLNKKHTKKLTRTVIVKEKTTTTPEENSNNNNKENPTQTQN